jgi:peptidoglycan/xylan/chitin deacetylase (PgdA/CDA1 family)
VGVSTDRRQVRQLLVGLAALPLTVLPFVAYANLTPEGRLVRDRAKVAVAPPRLPRLSPEWRELATTVAPRYAGPVMALAYHGIGSASDGEGGFVVSPKRFGEHLATLAAAGMNTVTAAQVAEAFNGGPPLPPNAVMVSFDDGRADAMMFADPLLKQAGMAATMFVITGAASEPGIYYSSWDRIESYAGSGRWDIQSHTATSHREHDTDGDGSLPMLTSLAEGETLEEYRLRVRQDLADAGAAIEDHVGRRPVAFAYPFGAYGADRSNDPAIQNILREEVGREYSVAFQQDDQDTVPLLSPDQDRLLLRRLEVENWSGLQLLQRIARAADPGAPVIELPDLPEPEPEPLAEELVAPAAPAARTPSPSTTRPRTTATRAPQSDLTDAVLIAGTVPAPTVPPLTTPPPPPTTTLPPPTIPPTTRPPVVTTAPPTTKPPVTTAPPTTQCKPAGKSGNCAGGAG